MRFATLEEWLAWQETLHSQDIEFGLERVERVLARLGLQAPAFTVITVGGTNGKGSCVALLDAMLRAHGYRVGAYLSPHLSCYNERVRIDGRDADDTMLMQAFERVEAARDGVPLTYFEFGTLAAVVVIAAHDCHYGLLEVGLGGRLDAVNALPPAISVVTSVALDHQSWLGDDRESIGREKAGIFRRGRPAVVGDPHPPDSLIAYANSLGTDLRLLRRDFDYRRGLRGWSWHKTGKPWLALPRPALSGTFQLRNAACALAALYSLGDRWSPVRLGKGLEAARLPGRFETVRHGQRCWVFDVAHNPAAGTTLARCLAQQGAGGKTLAIVGMLEDKNAAAFIGALIDEIDEWVVAPCEDERGMPVETLANEFERATGEAPERCPTIAAALEFAYSATQPGDRIVVTGSFTIVGPAREQLGLYSDAQQPGYLNGS